MSSLTSEKLPTCNLYLIGRGRDANGNSLVKLGFWTGRNFSIQMGAGSLPKTYGILRGLTPKEIKGLSKTDLTTISKEVANYVKNHGSDMQKKKLKME
jgi:hypothetical protein